MMRLLPISFPSWKRRCRMSKQRIKRLIPYLLLLAVFLFPLYKVIEHNVNLRRQWEIKAKEIQEDIVASHDFATERYAGLSLPEVAEQVSDQLATLKGIIKTMNYQVEEGIRNRDDYSDFILVTRDQQSKVHLEFGLVNEERVYLPLAAILRTIEGLDDDQRMNELHSLLDDYTKSMAIDKSRFDKRTSYLNVYGHLFLETSSLSDEGVHLTIDNGALTLDANGPAASKTQWLEHFAQYMQSVPERTQTSELAIKNDYLKQHELQAKAMILDGSKVAILLENDDYELLFNQDGQTAIVSCIEDGNVDYVINIPDASMQFIFNANTLEARELHQARSYSNDAIPFDMQKLFEIVDELFNTSL